MRILRSLSFPVLFILVSFLVSPKVLVAQESAPTPTRLALEVTYYPGRKPAYQTVQVADSQQQGTWYALFGHIASWRPIAGAPVIRAVRLVPRIEGDAVRVIVSTMWGEKALNNEQRVASYLIRENEKIHIEELRQFGIEPFGIKLIRVAPNLTPVPPVILKGVASLVVINAVSVDMTLPSYRITLFNQSGKDIVGLAVDVATGTKIETTAKPRSQYGKTLIAAGKTYELQVPAPVRAQETPNGYAPGTLSNPEILIKAVVFEDGTFEGDPESAAEIRGYRAGEKMELPDLIAAVDKALISPSANVSEALRNLEVEVSSLSSDVEPVLLKSLASEFPELGKEAAQKIKIAVQVSAIVTKTKLLNDIHKLQGEGTQALTANEYREWLNKTRDLYTQWLARL
ncbi:MAG TPA: hypothetical protein VII34_01010 [Pyrinomonadaceae bacterium]